MVCAIFADCEFDGISGRAVDVEESGSAVGSGGGVRGDCVGVGFWGV